MKKDEIVEALNEFFGFEVNWSKMSREDLQKIYDFLNDPKNVIGRLIDVMGVDEFIKTANNTILHKLVDERPVRKFLKELLLGER
jgi:hypothetical protein